MLRVETFDNYVQPKQRQALRVTEVIVEMSHVANEHHENFDFKIKIFKAYVLRCPQPRSLGRKRKTICVLRIL